VRPIPFKVSDVLIVRLAADLNDLRQEFIPVVRSFCLVHVYH